MVEWATKDELRNIMEQRDVNVLQKYGGIEGVLNRVHGSRDGLPTNSPDFNERETIFGKNQFPTPKTKPFLSLWFEAFNDRTLIILIILAIISLASAILIEKGENYSWMDGSAILATVCIVTLVSSFNTWSQERQFQKLNERQKERNILLIRDGQTVQESIFNIRVGDVFVVQTGEILPVDGLILESSDITCDEAPMTGESNLIKKDIGRCPFMLCGCKVQTGVGRMVVVAVGLETQFGQVKKAILENTKERLPTPLQQKLTGLSETVGNLGFIAALATLFLLITFWGFALYREPKLWEGGKYLLVLIDYFIIAVTIIVMAVPEGLPLAVTISLAYSMKRMLKDNNLVRRLESCETMGGATTICSDKTGTLTKNIMETTSGFFDGAYRSNLSQLGVDFGEETEDRHHKSLAQLNPPSQAYIKLLSKGISLNSTSNIKRNTDQSEQKYKYLGNVTECAMLAMITDLGRSYNIIRDSYKTVQIFPFSSERKRMSTLLLKKKEASQDVLYLFTKGASEIVSTLCTTVSVTGRDRYSIEKRIIDNEYRRMINECIQQMASNGLRTIAIAGKVINKSELPAGNLFDGVNPYPDDSAPEKDLTLIGICGIKDPLRPEVPNAIADCKTAKIVVRMVTGDNINTAMNIAQSCGIYEPKVGVAIEGPVFRELNEDDRLRLIPRIQVMARSSPIDKHLLVSGLQKLGHVVAVTGDGTNDAPALSKADVGFAMGITGTEVAKDAAAIIITDDNFASIVKASMWGRNVYDSIRKFIQFQLTVNLVAISISVIGAIFAITPLTALQMLWVNLIMDTLAALALATEIPTRMLLKRDPYGKEDPIICGTMWRNIIAGFVYQLTVLCIILFLWGEDDTRVPCPLEQGDEIELSHLLFPNGLCKKYLLDPTVHVFSKQHFAFLFNTFIFMQLGNEVTSRTCYNQLNFFNRILSAHMFLGVVIVTLILQIGIMLIPGITTVFGIIPITNRQWILSLIFGVGIIPFQLLIRIFIPLKEPFHGAIKIQDDGGVPPGVYTLADGAPDGCQLNIHSAQSIIADAVHENGIDPVAYIPRAPAPVKYELRGHIREGEEQPKLFDVVSRAYTKHLRLRAKAFSSQPHLIKENFILSDYSLNSRVGAEYNSEFQKKMTSRFKRAATKTAVSIKQGSGDKYE